MLRFLVLRHVNKIGFRTGVTFVVLSNCSCSRQTRKCMASAILYCEVCHQNVALNDNFCSHRGIQLPTEELLIKYYFSQGYKYCKKEPQGRD